MCMYLCIHNAHASSAIAVCFLSSCVDELDELMTLLEENPAVEFSSLVQDEEENFKVCSLIPGALSFTHTAL